MLESFSTTHFFQVVARREGYLPGRGEAEDRGSSFLDVLAWFEVERLLNTPHAIAWNPHPKTVFTGGI
jgi:hypothetical protein